MPDLDKDLNKKLINLFENKKYSEIEFELDALGDIEKLPTNLLMAYAVAKALNLKSKKEDFEKAAYFFEKVYVLNKSNLDALYNLIIVSLKCGVFKYVHPHLIERIKINDKDEKVIEALHKINFALGNVSESHLYSSRLIEVNPQYPGAWEDLLSSLNYIKNKSQRDYLKLALEFDKLPEINNSLLTELKKKTNKKQIKLAFLSPDFKTHSVSFFLKDFLSKIIKKDFKIFAFSNLDLNLQDVLTNELKELFDEWHDIKKMSDIDFVNLVRSLDIDILVDLAGLTVGNRIQALRARCAPIQISWLGYCNTLGIKNMDYLIADPNLIKKEEEFLYSEKILYLPKIWNVMSKQKNLPNINDLPSKEKSIFTFGSFNNFTKLCSETIKVWSKILNNSNSRLILKSGSATSNTTIKNIRKKFEENGVDKNKLLVLDKSLSRDDHLKEYNKIDIALDTFPFPGVTTTFESLLMGVPVLTMKGFNFNSRCGESINLNLGMDEFIAINEDHYLEKAIQLQEDLEKLKLLRKSLRERILTSPLFDADSFANEFSSILKKIWFENIDPSN